MNLSYNLKELNKLKEYPEKELTVALQLKNDLHELFMISQRLQSNDTIVIQQQINFIEEEITFLKEKKQRLANIYDIFYNSTQTTKNTLSDAIRSLKGSIT